MNKRKKVNFSDPVGPREPSGIQDLPSSRTEIGDAKTSEFKSFKRLLGETDPKLRSNQVPNHNNKVRTFEVNDYVQEKNESVIRISDTKRSKVPIQKVTPIAQRSPPAARISQNSELDNESKYKHSTSSFLSPMQKVTSDCWKSSLSPEFFLLNSGPKHEYEGIFLKKRKKLLELAAEASSQKVVEILSNKFDSRVPAKAGYQTKTRKCILCNFTGIECPLCLFTASLDELPMPEQKGSSARYHSLAPHKTYGGNKELQVTLREDPQHTLRSKREMGFLVGHAEDQVFPICHPLQAGSGHHRWQPLSASEEKGKSHLYAENKSASTAGIGWYQTAGHMFPKDDELITLPQDYPVVHAFPMPYVLDSGLQRLQWHPNPIVDDEGIFEKESASNGYYAMSHMVPKVKEFACLPRDHAELQAFPAREPLDAGLQVRRRCFSSGLEGGGIFESKSVSAGHHMMDCLLPRDNELLSLPARHAIQTGCQGKNKHSISDLHSENRLTSSVEFGVDFEHGKCGFHPQENMLSKIGYWIPNNSPSGSQFNDQSIVPYSNSASSYDLNGQDWYSEFAKEQCTLPLLQWRGSIEPELSGPSAGDLPKGLDCLPLTLYSAPDLPDGTGLGTANVYGSRNTFSSLPSGFRFSTRMPGSELELNSLTVNFDKEHCWSMHSELPFDKQQMDGRLGFSATRNRYDGSEDEKIQRHLPADFSSLGPNCSLDREKSIFSWLPERLNWH